MGKDIFYSAKFKVGIWEKNGTGVQRSGSSSCELSGGVAVIVITKEMHTKTSAMSKNRFIV
jgi:hypothetical protein